MNDRLRRGPIFKAPKANPNEKIMFRLRKNKVDNTRSSLFRLYIDNNNIEVFINTILEWTQDQTKPKFKDFVAIQTPNKDGFIIVMQAIGAQKKNIFTNAFGLNNVEIPDDLKGERSLDNYEGQIDRNIDIYFRPQKFIDDADVNNAFAKMCELFGIDHQVQPDEIVAQQQAQVAQNMPFNPEPLNYLQPQRNFPVFEQYAIVEEEEDRETNAEDEVEPEL